MSAASRYPRLFAAACLAIVAAPAFSQAPRLGVGDPAPALQVRWLKGAPVAAFDKDMVYVVEFWATWCGPCRSAMPHLSELARKYAGKAVVIGVNIFEKTAEGKPYGSVLPAVKTFVDDMGDRMDYRVAMDRDDLPMAKTWMNAAGQNGIPATFLVKGGRVVWIGHPMGVDKVLDEVLKGTYDMSAFSAQLKAENDKKEKRFGPYLTLDKEVKAAVAAKDFAKAVALIDQAKDRIDPELRLSVVMLKFLTFLKFDVTQALTFGRMESGKDADLAASFAMVILSEEVLPLEAYRFALEGLEPLLANPAAPKPWVYHQLATVKAKMGNFSGAVESEGKALETGKAALAAGELPEHVNAKRLEEYREALKTYEAQAATAGKR